MNTSNQELLFLLLALSYGISSSAIVKSKDQFQLNITGNKITQPSLESTQEARLHRPARPKRDIATMLKGFDDRLFGVEYRMTQSNTTIEHMRGFLSAVGFLLQSDDYRNVNPCRGNNSRMTNGDNAPNSIQGGQDTVEKDENDWTLIGSSTCVKIIHGHYTYDQAAEMCNNELQIGQDITYPEVLRLDSVDKLNSIQYLLRTHQPFVAGVWVDIDSNTESIFGNFSTMGTTQGCTELRNERQGIREARGHIPWVTVDCVRTNSIICEKTLPVPYAEIARKYLEREDLEKEKDLYAYHDRVELKNQVDNLNGWKQLREEQLIVESEQAKLLVDQGKHLTEENDARKEDQAEMQTLLEDLKQRIVDLEVWKQTLSEQVAADSLQIKQMADQIQVLENQSSASKTEEIFLRRSVMELKSWQSKQINLQMNSTTYPKTYAEIHNTFVGSINRD